MQQKEGSTEKEGSKRKDDRKKAENKIHRVAIDWIIDVWKYFKLGPATYFCAVHLFMEYRSRSPSSFLGSTIQTIIAACLYLAGILHEVVSPDERDFKYISGSEIGPEKLKACAVNILDTLCFEIYCVPTLYTFVCAKAEEEAEEAETKRERALFFAFVATLNLEVLCEFTYKKIAEACFFLGSGTAAAEKAAEKIAETTLNLVGSWGTKAVLNLKNPSWKTLGIDEEKLRQYMRGDKREEEEEAEKRAAKKDKRGLECYMYERGVSYVKLESIGEGTFGKVYLCLEEEEIDGKEDEHEEKADEEKADEEKKAAVAVKKYKEELFESTCLRELALLAYLDHPNVARGSVVYLKEKAEGEEWYGRVVMPFYGTQSLGEYVQSQPVSKAVKQLLVQKVCQGLFYLHQNGVMHRDLKSANIILDNETKNPVILDFSLGRFCSSSAYFFGGRRTRSGQSERNYRGTHARDMYVVVSSA